MILRTLEPLDCESSLCVLRISTSVNVCILYRCPLLCDLYCALLWSFEWLYLQHYLTSSHRQKNYNSTKLVKTTAYTRTHIRKCQPGNNWIDPKLLILPSSTPNRPSRCKCDFNHVESTRPRVIIIIFPSYISNIFSASHTHFKNAHQTMSDVLPRAQTLQYIVRPACIRSAKCI